jgi:hypothetical protein
MGWMIGGSSPDRGWKFFSSPLCPDWLLGPSNLLSDGYQGLIRGGKTAGREADQSPPSSAEVKECMKLCFHSPSTPSWRGAQLKHRDNFTFTFFHMYASGVLGFDSRRGLGIFLFTTASRTALVSTQTPIQWAPGCLSLGGKAAAVCSWSLTSNAKVKECVELYLHSPSCLHGVMLS